MAKDESRGGYLVDEALAAAGANVVAAKEALAKLDAAFSGEAGDIPEQAMRNWSSAYLPAGMLAELGLVIGKRWEKDLVAGLPKERQLERAPGARKSSTEKGKIVVPA